MSRVWGRPLKVFVQWVIFTPLLSLFWSPTTSVGDFSTAPSSTVFTSYNFCLLFDAGQVHHCWVGTSCETDPKQQSRRPENENNELKDVKIDRRAGKNYWVYDHSLRVYHYKKKSSCFWLTTTPPVWLCVHNMYIWVCDVAWWGDISKYSISVNLISVMAQSISNQSAECLRRSPAVTMLFRSGVAAALLLSPPTHSFWSVAVSKGIL